MSVRQDKAGIWRNDEHSTQCETVRIGRFLYAGRIIQPPIPMDKQPDDFTIRTERVSIWQIDSPKTQ